LLPAGLRSRRRETSDGNLTGGNHLDRGHIYHVLTNPLYAGRIRNIARAHVWFEAIRAGQTYDQIAETAGTSKRRVLQMIPLAFLAPDIVRDVLDGNQPVGFTSGWCKSHELPCDWSDQRTLLATL
jgi:hypothetical protein